MLVASSFHGNKKMKHRMTVGALAAAVLLAWAPAQATTPANKPAAAEKTPAKSAPQARKQFLILADEYWDAVAKFNPVDATQNGDNRFDDQIGMAINPAERAKQFDRYRAYSKRLHAIPRAQLNRADRISYDVLAFELKTLLSYEPFPEHLLPINQMDSIPVTLANFSSGDQCAAVRGLPEPVEPAAGVDRPGHRQYEGRHGQGRDLSEGDHGIGAAAVPETGQRDAGKEYLLHAGDQVPEQLRRR
jgi:hypothetical protein